MGVHDFKLKKMPLFARKPININVLRSSTPKLAFLPANRYNCDFLSSHMSVQSFIKIERGSDGGP